MNRFATQGELIGAAIGSLFCIAVIIFEVVTHVL